MKILATADLHGDLPEVPECDILIVGGDICPVYGSHAPAVQARWLLDRFVPWLTTVPANDIIVIAGNHDFVFETDFNSKEYFPRNVRYLQDSGVRIGGYNFWGTPWVPNLRAWAFYGDQQKLQSVYNSVPEDVDVLISHGPPHSACDRVLYEHVGSEEFYESLVFSDAPDYKAIVCGHIHEGYGTHHVCGVPVVNVARMNVDYEPINPIVDITPYIESA